MLAGRDCAVALVLALVGCSDSPGRSGGLGHDAGSLDAGASDAGEARHDAQVPASDAGSGPRARAHVLEAHELAPKHEGQKARVGDVLMENDLVQFVITGSRGNDSYTDRAGTLIDGMLAGVPDDQAYDGIDEFIPLVNGCTIDASTVSIVRDGSDGGPVEVRASGKDLWIPYALNMLGSVPEQLGLDLTLVYTLAPDERTLRITTRVHNPLDREVPALLSDFVHFGDDEAEPFTLPAGFNLTSELRSFSVLGSAHETLRWAAALHDMDGVLGVITGGTINDLLGHDETGLGQYVTTDTVLSPGGTLEATRGLTLGRSVSEALRGHLHDTQASLAIVRGRVTAGGMGVPGARVSFLSGDGSSFHGQALTGEDGRFEAELPAGAYQAIASGRGMGEHVVVPGRPRLLAEGYLPAKAKAFTTSADEVSELSLELAPTARFTIEVRDSAGQGLASKLSFQPLDPHPVPLLVVGERALYHEQGIDYVFWSSDGKVQAAVPPGRYRVTASRGFAYSTATSDLTLVAGDNAPDTFFLTREIPALGFATIDSHAHAMDSQHGEVTRAERLVTSLAEGLDTHIGTDHDRLVDYAPLVSALGLEQAIAPVASVELTTPYGHHNIWPLNVDPMAPNGGAARWWLGGTLDELYDHYQELGGVVFQVNHGQDFFEPAGYDLGTGLVADMTRFTWRFNAMELQNGKSRKRRAFLVPVYHSLLNHGHHVAALGASDSHRRMPEVGSARSYVYVGEGSERAPDAMALAQAVTQLRTVASTGPLAVLETASGARMGDHVALTAGQSARLRITVWAPRWMALSRVRLWSNDGLVQAWDDTTTPAVAMPSGDLSIWFSHELDVSPATSQWYAVEVEGDEPTAPVSVLNWPWAHTSALFLDIQ